MGRERERVVKRPPEWVLNGWQMYDYVKSIRTCMHLIVFGHNLKLVAKIIAVEHFNLPCSWHLTEIKGRTDFQNAQIHFQQIRGEIGKLLNLEQSFAYYSML